MKHTGDQVLSILDRCCDSFNFPMLDNGYVYMAATRLSLFRSPEDWAMTIEVFGFSPRSGLPDICIHTFASSIDRKSTRHYIDQETHEGYITRHPNNETHFFFPIERGDWIDQDDPEFVAEAATGLTLRGKTIQLPNHMAYLRAGVTLSDPTALIVQEPPRVQVFELCRVLAHEHRDAVLAKPGERRVNVPAELRPLLTLDEWAHPDVKEDTERPSRSVTFQQLARVLVSGDVSAYRPAEASNTHWRNWPEGGTL
jgi:uncharacterized protein DUF7003